MEQRIDFKIEITTNLTEVDFLDVIFNLEILTDRIKNQMITYINTSSNHPPQIIKHLTQTISERLARNFSSAEIFEQSKPDYEEALKHIIYVYLYIYMYIHMYVYIVYIGKIKNKFLENRNDCITKFIDHNNCLAIMKLQLTKKDFQNCKFSTKSKWIYTQSRKKN